MRFEQDHFVAPQAGFKCHAQTSGTTAYHRQIKALGGSQLLKKF
jgi:hypothetical protein